MMLAQGMNTASAGFSGRPCTAARRSRQAFRVSAVVQERPKTELRKPREENVAGNFYVDHTCIDWCAPFRISCIGGCCRIPAEEDLVGMCPSAYMSLILMKCSHVHECSVLD
jgi:hypothetical protein